MDKLYRTRNMPLVLLLNVNSSDQEFIIDIKKFKRVGPSLIFKANYTDHPEKMNEKIYPLLLRFCSIHNELGDKIYDRNGNNEVNYDLTESNFLFNINIVCVGRARSGKSAGINALLQEYRAKEYDDFHDQKLAIYQVKNLPIKLIEIPGYYDEKSVKESFEILEKWRKEDLLMKNSVYVILFFIGNNVSPFLENDNIIIKEITNHIKSKIIYIITNSSPDLDEEEKEELFHIINNGLHHIIPISHKKEMLRANINNVVFANFHMSKYGESFGKKIYLRKYMIF